MNNATKSDYRLAKENECLEILGYKEEDEKFKQK
jgi:hypothetical protein